MIYGGKFNFRQRLKNKIDEQTFKDNKLSKLTLQGEANQFGNRQFDFKELNHNKLTFKVNKDKHIILDLQQMKSNFVKQLNYIQLVASLKEQPITIKLDANNVYFIYEPEKINKQYKSISNRSLALDMNPNQIGLSILEGDKLIYNQQFDLYKLTKTILDESNASSSTRAKYLNHKLQEEILLISKQIIKLAVFYKVKTVFIENLTNILKTKTENKANKTYKGKTFNRKTNVFWKRNLFITNLKKRCYINNIEVKEVLAHYTNFIGNMMYDFTDPINASIEINRRGQEIFINKDKTKFYPELKLTSLKDQWKKYLSADFKEWKEFCMWIKNSKMGYRVSLDKTTKSYKSFQMNSKRSKVTCYNFI
jgi:hypothetical protein